MSPRVRGGTAPDGRHSRRRLPPFTLYQDLDLHAVAKAPGLSTVSERWNPDAPTVIQELWRLWQRSDPDAPRPHVIHRLDRDTSGVLLFATHRDAQADVRRQFRERRVQKSYLALVLGLPALPRGTIEMKIGPNPKHPGAMMVVPHRGKLCITEYEVVERFRDLSLVRVRPLTGRTHQIRVALRHIGHPCAVDPLYGALKDLRLSRWKPHYRRGRGEMERPLIERVTLHAERLVIRHPRHGEPLEIEAPLPKDFHATLKQLRRWWKDDEPALGCADRKL